MPHRINLFAACLGRIAIYGDTMEINLCSFETGETKFCADIITTRLLGLVAQQLNTSIIMNAAVLESQVFRACF